MAHLHFSHGSSTQLYLDLILMVETSLIEHIEVTMLALCPVSQLLNTLCDDVDLLAQFLEEELAEIRGNSAFHGVVFERLAYRKKAPETIIERVNVDAQGPAGLVEESSEDQDMRQKWDKVIVGLPSSNLAVLTAGPDFNGGFHIERAARKRGERKANKLIVELAFIDPFFGSFPTSRYRVISHSRRR